MTAKIDYDEITKLVKFLEEKNLTEFELEVQGFKIKIARGVVAPPPAPVPTVQATTPQPAVPPAGPAAAPRAAEPAENLQYVTSPMVGTFYRAPDPSSPPYVEIGEEVKKGQTLCIIEAMKLMNEIECEVDGTIEEIFVENAKPVEFGQKLFSVKPTA